MAAPSKAVAVEPPYKRGSEWRKWDLHVHTPGTAHEDQYTSWDEFLDALKAEKEVAVLGVTDYLSVTNYEHLLKLKGSSNLGSIEMMNLGGSAATIRSELRRILTSYTRARASNH